MTPAPQDNDRVSALEERIAYQDRAIEDLSATVTDQWKQIEELKRELAKLTDQLREVESSIDRTGAPEPPPPHY